jgi:hypothetical protein
MIYKSVKELDPVKVGRFGLGFKSVFHITGKYILLCPFRNTVKLGFQFIVDSDYTLITCYTCKTAL